ncbi:MAG: glycosyltransferase [candidate division WOR-3 bacterium]|nr:MAG: glycosyltransferase [candidate division WOR-3 bacterium]
MARSKKEPPKKLLIITYYWPPLGGPGSLRPVKFAKYLPHFGIKPLILTRRDIAYHSYDLELAEDVGGVRVLRTFSIDPARFLYLVGMRKYHVANWHGHVKRVMNFPDNKTPWVPFAYYAARKLDFDQIFVTAPPFSAFITGYYLAMNTGKPLIADFRDAWLEFPFKPYEGMLQAGFVRSWEKKIATTAKFITVVDENLREVLVQRYPEISQKIAVIPNGYDPEDFSESEKPDVFTISYLGTIREERDPGTVLHAVDDFRTEHRLGNDNIRFRFIGHIEDSFLPEMNQYPFVERTGHLSYKKAINTFCNSHLGVLITTGSTYFFPSRQNEYLASGLPIIVCGKSKGLHVLGKAFKMGYPGWTFDLNDIEGMKKRIAFVYQKYKRGESIVGKTPYTGYTRKNLTGALAKIINTF